MNPFEQEESLFDQKADQKIRLIEKILSVFDPDEIDTELAGDVLTVLVNNREKIIINRHRAARQIWMSALRQAWHFNEELESGSWKTEKSKEELVETLRQVLSKMVGRKVILAAV